MQHARPTSIYAPRRSSAVPYLALAAVVVLLVVLLVSVVSCALSPKDSETAEEAVQGTLVEDGSQESAEESAMEEASAESEAAIDVSSGPTSTVEWAGNVEEFLQFPILQGGCEIASLSCVLRSMGYDEVDDYTIADEYLEYGDMVDGYSGDPYYYGGAFPPPIIDAANAFLEDKGAAERAVDLSGLSFDVVSEWISAGYPVLVWSTMYMDEPEFTDTMVGPYEWWNNEHCVVAYGFDENGDVLVMDPLDGIVVRDGEEFARIYEECGELSCVIC